MKPQVQVLSELQALHREHESDESRKKDIPALPDGSPDRQAMSTVVAASTAWIYIRCLIAKVLVEAEQANKTSRDDLLYTQIAIGNVLYPRLRVRDQAEQKKQDEEALAKMQAMRARCAQMLEIPLKRPAKASDFQRFLAPSVMSPELATFIDSDLSTLPVESR